MEFRLTDTARVIVAGRASRVKVRLWSIPVEAYMTGRPLDFERDNSSRRPNLSHSLSHSLG
ncbi:MAG: hypothetical protein ABI353_08505 [Isosphaeraceae bacterium]